MNKRKITGMGPRKSTKKKVPKRINSRTKGCVGERELAEFLRAHGYEARRGQQFSGLGDSPDVVTDVPGVHFECKRVEAGSLHKWLAQAVRDAKNDRKPVVAHRRNHGEWVAILRLEDFLNIVSFGA